jgi:membrane fusion protein (multidrug efflux system)
MSNDAPQVPAAATPADTAGQARSRTRRIALFAASTVFVVIAVAAGLYWQLELRNYESTDNAYVGGHVVQITPQTSGTVISVGADDTDVVAAGQTLVKLDPADAQIELEQAQAQLGQAVRETRALYTNNDTLGSSIALREAELTRAQDDLARRREIADSGAVSNEELHHAEISVAAAEAALHTAREQLTTNRSNTDGTSLAQHPNVQRAAARVREAFLAARRGEIVAPLAGQVAKRNVQVGQRVQPGATLMAVIPLDQLWVDANFKEVQLARMRIGQQVTLTADVYGSGITYHGKVAGLGAGTGAAFALLPAQNATGNWIKVVQRVPVRIELDRTELRQHPLRIGLSVKADVDVRDNRGAPIGATATAPADPAVPATDRADQTDVYTSTTHDADVLVDSIIAANLGRRPGAVASAPGNEHSTASMPRQAEVAKAGS